MFWEMVQASANILLQRLEQIAHRTMYHNFGRRDSVKVTKMGSVGRGHMPVVQIGRDTLSFRRQMDDDIGRMLGDTIRVLNP